MFLMRWKPGSCWDELFLTCRREMNASAVIENSSIHFIDVLGSCPWCRSMQSRLEMSYFGPSQNHLW